MCVKEVHIERNKKLYSQEASQAQIADDVKYLCTYFNQHRMIFEDRYVYQKMLIPLEKALFHNKKNKGEDEDKTLVEETIAYSTASYEFGKRVFFKTFKLERRKKFKSFYKNNIDNYIPINNAAEDIENEVKTIQRSSRNEYNGFSSYKNSSNLTHTSPAFILNGFKPNDTKNIYNIKTGKIQRKTSNELYKIMWYNAYQEKFSEEYLPKEFFVDDKNIYIWK